MKNYLTNISLLKLFSHFFSALLALFLFSGNLYAGGANLAWDASTSSNVGGYKVSYGLSSGNYTSTIDVGNTTTYAATGLQAGTQYYFAVKSYNTSRTDESAYSNVASITVPATATLAADFTEDKTSGPASLAVNFTPVTTGTVTSWTWAFPGSYTPSVTNAMAKVTTATYATAGTYDVSLTATGPSGSVTKKYLSLIKVTAVPVPASTPTSAPVTGTSDIGLVADLGFDEAITTIGGIVADASGNANHGIITNAVRIANGHSGNALSFNGTNAWVTIPDNASLDLSTSMTLEAWVYPTELTAGGGTVILKEGFGTEVYSLYAKEDTTVPISYINNGSYNPVSGPQQLPLNQWSHLVATYDETEGVQKLYVNNILAGSSITSGPIQQSAGVLRIGGNSLWGEYFQGSIDEVKVYNRALTATEVCNNFKAPLTCSASVPRQFILGDQTDEPWVDYRAQGVAQAFQAVPVKSGKVTQLKVFLDSTSTATSVQAAMYTDISDHPGTLVAQGTLNTLNLGAWNLITIPAASVTAGQPYWLAIMGLDGIIGIHDQVGSGTSVMERTSTRTVLTSLPTTWTPSTSIYRYLTNASMSIYGNGQ